MKGHRFSVLMLCQGARLLRFPTTQLIGRLSLYCAAALLARRDGFLAQRSGWEMRIDDTRPKDAVNILKPLTVWLAIPISQPSRVRPVAILHEVAYLVSDGRGQHHFRREPTARANHRVLRKRRILHYEVRTLAVGR